MVAETLAAMRSVGGHNRHIIIRVTSQHGITWIAFVGLPARSSPLPLFEYQQPADGGNAAFRAR
jgi:hypothetical protein